MWLIPCLHHVSANFANYDLFQKNFAICCKYAHGLHHLKSLCFTLQLGPFLGNSHATEPLSFLLVPNIMHRYSRWSQRYCVNVELPFFCNSFCCWKWESALADENCVSVCVIVCYILQALWNIAGPISLCCFGFICMTSDKSISQSIILFVPKISEAYLSEVYNVKALIQAFPSQQQL